MMFKIRFNNLIKIFIMLVMLISISCSSSDSEMNYGKTKWGMSPSEVAIAQDYRKPAVHSKIDKETQSIYNMQYKALLVEARYFYAYHEKFYLLIFEFGHVTPILDSVSNPEGPGSSYFTITKTKSPVRRESKKMMIHYFNNLIEMHSPEFGKGKTTDKSKNGKLDMEHIWESDIAIWRVSLETDNKNYHRLYLTAYHKELNKKFKLDTKRSNSK